MALNFLNDGYFAGKVGIGTESPGAKLHVNPTTTDEIAIAINGTQNYSNNNFQRISAGDANSLNRLSIGFGYTNPTEWAIRYSSYGRHEFYTGNDWDNAANTEKMVITSGGNVGIGTTGPTSKLTIADTAFTTAYDSIKGLFFDNSNITSGDENFGAGIEFGKLGTAGNLYKKAAIIPVQSGTDSDQMGISFFVSNSAGQASPVIEAMRVDYGGNVGIGTDNPGSKLEVKSTATSIATFLSTMSTGGFTGYSNSTGGVKGFVGYGGTLFGTGFTNSDFGLRSQGNIALSTNGGSVRLFIDTVGSIKFNNYDSTNNTGTPTYLLGTDASGNIVKTNTVPGSGAGPYLPLAGGTMTGTNGVIFPDNFKLNLGTGSDLQIYHTGSNNISFIKNSNAGGLRLQSDELIIFAANGTTARADFDIAVKLFYNDSKKFETTSAGIAVTGDAQIDSALLSNQENTDVDTGTETVASVAIATYTAAFFDFVIKKTTNVRSGTVYACHDGTSVAFTETSTQDLGDTSDVTLSVDISGGNMRLRATTTSDDWSVKSLIRAI